MARSYTNAQKGSIKNYQVIAYYNNVVLGAFAAGDHNFNFTYNTIESDSSLYGDTPIKIHETGIDVTQTFNVTSYSKDVIKTCFDPIAQVSGGTATNSSSPFTGAIEAKANPGTINEAPLVIYPIFKDVEGIFGAAGTQYIDDTSNPLAILIPQAVATEGYELVFNSTARTEFTLTFRGVYDVVNDRMFIQDDGIATDGTYTI